LSLYAESSAVLAWLLGEARGSEVREQMAEADVVLSSDLTLLECERVLIRAVATDRMPEAAAADRRAVLARAAQHWAVLALGEEIVRRARQPFPQEPIRTLDALHLSAALQARSLVPGTRLLSLEDRLRACAGELGFTLSPH